ncbi:MAG: nucleotidyltransferase [Myxococcota bacterium]
MPYLQVVMQDPLSAIDGFLRASVNISQRDAKAARASRDWLLNQIHSFPQNEPDFPRLYSERDIGFGSFARKTKIQPLDDVDLVVGIHASGASYIEDAHGCVRIAPVDGTWPAAYRDQTGYVSSTQIINRFAKSLRSVPQYSTTGVGRRREGVVVELSSYPWNFDIIPGFFTKPDMGNRTFYLIPDGNGAWQKTDPRRDRARVQRINRLIDGKALNAVRAIKYWQRRPTMPTISSYLVETMVLDYLESNHDQTDIDFLLAAVLSHMSTAVNGRVEDPKNIQGDLNTLERETRSKVSARAHSDARLAIESVRQRLAGQHHSAINGWAEIFGKEFSRK